MYLLSSYDLIQNQSLTKKIDFCVAKVYHFDIFNK